MNDVWLPLEEACSLMDWTDRWMRAKVQAGKVKARQAEVSRNGKPKLEISLESLPAEAQAKWKSEVGSQKPGMKDETAIVVSPTEILIRQEASIAPARIGQLSLLPPAPPAGVDCERWDEAMRRWQIIEPILNGDYKKTMFAADKHGFVQLLARQHKVAPATLYNWRRRALEHDEGGRERGPLGLVDAPRKDKGQFERPLSEDQKQELRANLTRGYTARGCWRELRRRLQAEGLAEERIPSYRACLTYCNALPAGDVTLALRGRQKFEDQNGPYMRLKHDDYGPHELAVLDHTQFDTAVNFFGRACFPWLTLFLDWHSRYPVGFWIAETPSSYTVAMAARMMFIFFGAPQEVLTDQGRDVRGTYISGDAFRARKMFRTPSWNTDERDGAQIRGVLQSAGVKQVRFAQGRHPQTKGIIERFFGTMNRDFSSRFSSYRGGNTRLRTEAVDPLLVAHNAACKRGENSPLPNIEDFALMFWHWLYEDYAHREHEGQGMRGRTPFEAFRPGIPLPAERVNLLLLKREPRKVIRCAVEIFGERFESEELYHHNGHDAEVAYDPHGLVLPDLAEVVVYCCGAAVRAQCAQPMSLRDVNQKELEARLAARARLRKSREQLITAWQDATPDPLTRYADSLTRPTQPKSLTGITLKEATRVAAADPRYARPVPVRDAPGRRKVFICDAVDEDAALFAEVAGPLPQEER